MKTKLMLMFMVLISISMATTKESDFAVVRELMDVVSGSAEWCDNLKSENPDGEMIDIEFPTMDALFAFEANPSMALHELNLAQRKAAFDRFLMSIAVTNRVYLSRRYQFTAALAFSVSLEKGYTNALMPAIEILKRPSAPCRDSALLIFCEFANPSLAMNQVFGGVVTNLVGLSCYDRYSIAKAYLDKVSLLSATNAVSTNVVSFLWNQRMNLDAFVEVDRFLAKAQNGYATSTNRLSFCGIALSNNSLSAEEKAYFTGVTNQLMNATNSLERSMMKR